MKRQELIKWIESIFQPDESIIAVVWTADDVKSAASEMNESLTTEQVEEVLDRLNSKHDASIGINWSVIRDVISFVLSETVDEDEDKEN